MKLVWLVTYERTLGDRAERCVCRARVGMTSDWHTVVFVKYLGSNTGARLQRTGPIREEMQFTCKLLAFLPARQRFPGC